MVLDTRLAPGFIRVRYSGITVPHNQIIPIKFAGDPEPGVEPNLELSDSSSLPMSDALNLWITAFKESFAAGTVFGFAECYAVDAETGVRTFIFVTQIADEGSSIEDNVPLVEGVWVFKTSAGKPLKVYAMEGVYAADVRNIGTTPADGRADVVTYITGPTNMFYGRNDAWPLAFMTFTSKENDVLRKRSLLPAI